MIQPAASTARGRTSRWGVWLAALVGLCMVIVVLAAPAAHAQPSGIGDLTSGEEEQDAAWEDRIDAERYALTMPIGFDPAHGEVTDDDIFERVKRITDLVMYTIAALFHDFGKFLTQLGLWLLELAFSFTVIEAIREAVAELSRAMQRTFVAGIGLDDFAVFLAVFYCGIQLLRRRTAHSLGELTASMLVAVIGATLVAYPLRALDATANTVRSISVAMMDLMSDDPGSTSVADSGYSVPKEMSDQLYRSMIVESYDAANWGQLLTGNCAKKRDEFLRGENHADHNLFVKEMWDAGEECHNAVIFNTSMSPERVGVALLTFLVSVVLLFFNGILSASVMGGQFVLGQVVVALPLAVVFGTVPGTGRQIALKVAYAAGQASAAVILAGFMLTVLVKFQTALLSLPGKSLLTRYTLLLVMVIMLWRYRAPVRDMVREILLHFTQRLKTKSPGGLAPNLLEDRNLWENSVTKRIKENFVDSSYRGSRNFLGRTNPMRRRTRGAGSGPSDTRPPSAAPEAPTPGAGRATRRSPREYTHDVKEGVKQFGRDWKRRGQTTAKIARAAGRVARKGVVGAGDVAGVLTTGGFYKETGRDLGHTAAEVTRASARATAQGARTGARAIGRTPRVVARLTRAATRAGHNLGHDVAEHYQIQREYPRSVLPGSHKRVMRRREAKLKKKTTP